MANETTQSPVEKLKAKYKTVPEAQGAETAYRAFETPRVSSAADYRQSRQTLQRVSSAPKLQVPAEESVAAEYAGVQLKLADLADDYGKLNVDFSTTFGSRSIYSPGEVASMAWYNIRHPFNSKKRRELVRKVQRDAIGRKDRSLTTLVDKMLEVIDETHENTKQGKGYARQLQADQVSHLKNLDTSLIDRLKTRYGGSAQYAELEKALREFEADLTEMDTVLTDYEGRVKSTQDSGDLTKANQLTEEMMEVLRMKHQALDGRLTQEGELSEMRRAILESAEGIQSAKGAIQRARLTYKCIQGQIDAMNELEFKYRHAKEDILPQMRIDASAAVGAMQGLKMNDALRRTAEVFRELSDANVRIATCLTSKVFELVQEDLSDPESAKRAEAEIDAYLVELNKNKLAWAEATGRVGEVDSQPRYDTQK